MAKNDSNRTRAQLQNLGFDGVSEAVQCFWVRVSHFGFHWHYHPEYEITYVQRGQGTRVVGDHVNYFEDGDFVFLGSNLPHTWISDDDFNRSEEDMEVLVLQFHPDLFSKEWLVWSEMVNLKSLLKNANRGLRFTEGKEKEAAEILIEMEKASGFRRLMLTMELLNFLGKEKGEPLASPSYIPPLNDSTEERLLTVCQYIHDNFTLPIKLEKVSRLANMNTTSFCRFFKKSTGQSVMEYVNDLRIGKACNLLLSGQRMNISEVAFRSGFNSQTLFNRSFLKKKNMTPRDFRRLKRAG